MKSDDASVSRTALDSGMSLAESWYAWNSVECNNYVSVSTTANIDI